MKCRHPKIRAIAKPDRNGEGYQYSGAYICPDCQEPVEVESNYAENPDKCKPSFRIARWSMAGVGDYWKRIQPDGTFESESDRQCRRESAKMEVWDDTRRNY